MFSFASAHASTGEMLGVFTTYTLGIAIAITDDVRTDGAVLFGPLIIALIADEGSLCVSGDITTYML